ALSIIDAEPRIKDTPFVFGGNMVVARELVEAGIPFDPSITRGEDMDYLVNVKTEGYAFVLDRELRVMHKPPPSHHEEWVKLREDIRRFLYVRQKLKEQRRYGVKHLLTPEDLDPYPGYFIGSTIRVRVFFTCLLLALDYTVKMKFRDAGKTLRSISLIFYDYSGDVEKFYGFKKRWIDILPTLASDKSFKQALTSKIS
ncbi:MAG: glycosyltransferase family 2 protein, partial [Nitrososphaerales archaeon]